ncbi:MAG: helix-turn-helix transcriptional regulator [Ruminococcaceae bacterium]|nr:helix-turn-helix transcriptional regulator [Oscillospiraceae bacterium]
MVDFGAKLKKLRLEEGLTQQQLADRIGVTKSVVSYYELQERYPSPEVLTKLASIFHVTTDSLLGIERSGNSIDLSGLDEEDIITVKRLVTSLRNKNLCK